MSDERSVVVALTYEQADEYSGAISDVLCWLRGFEAAHFGREDSQPLPPEWRNLRDLNIKIKEGMRGAGRK